MRLARYRYRTAVLAGRWRDTRDAALNDAVAAKQARADDSAPDGVHWLVPGEIEIREEDSARLRTHAGGRA
jgi:hypothetical protein